MEIFCDDKNLICDDNIFDANSLNWFKADYDIVNKKAISLEDACIWQQKKSGRMMRAPIGVIGPREATDAQIEMAYALGKEFATLGLSVICGGRQGVMEAVCKGVYEKGGISVGLLPEGDFNTANPYVTVPVATGIGIARNALISRAAVLVIAVGGGLGTISEIALSLQFGKKVFTICDAPFIEGVQEFNDLGVLKKAVLEHIFSYK